MNTYKNGIAFSHFLRNIHGDDTEIQNHKMWGAKKGVKFIETITNHKF